MAKKQKSADLQSQILRLMEMKKEAERKEKLEARQAEEKVAMKLGRLVLELHKAGFTGFVKADFVKQVNELVAGAGLLKDKAPATATATGAKDSEGVQVDDAPVADVLDSGTAEPAGEAADAEAIADGSGSSNAEIAAVAENTTPAENSDKKKFWGN